MKMLKIKPIYSINFDKVARSPKKIIYLIYHYTGMKSEKKAIERLRKKRSKVSCHYFIRKNGAIINMVPDRFIAWHAGISCWKKHLNLNDKSIGIEIQNAGHSNVYSRFSKKQIKSTLYLTKILKKKYNIKVKNILGHSDVAPFRKKDPGEKFPWKRLAKLNLCKWHNLNEKKIRKFRNLKVNNIEESLFYKNLRKIGYSKVSFNSKKNLKNALIKAFQRKFRQNLINGKIDKECYLISKNLLKK